MLYVGRFWLSFSDILGSDRCDNDQLILFFLRAIFRYDYLNFFFIIHRIPTRVRSQISHGRCSTSGQKLNFFTKISRDSEENSSLRYWYRYANK